MPVDDHPVHQKTKVGPNFRYGCNNRIKGVVGYYAEDRQYRPDGTFIKVHRFIENKMSTDCKYDLYHNDSACTDCRWRPK